MSTDQPREPEGRRTGGRFDAIRRPEPDLDLSKGLDLPRVHARIVPAPRFAGMRQWNCADCGHEDLANPVFVDTGEGVTALGSGCAAKALGLPVRKVVAQADQAEAAASREEARRAEVMDNKRRALEAFEASSDSDPYLEAARRDYHRLGGYDRLGWFSGWLRRVAETGELSPPVGT